MDRLSLSQWIRSVLALLAIVSMMACDAAGGSYDPSVDGVLGDDPSSTVSLSGISVPEAVMSTQDGAATVAAVRSGLNVSDYLIDTSFSCYDHDAIDYSQPFVTLTVAGTQFTSTLGNGRIDYDPEYGDFTLVGGPFESDEYAYISFDDHGQEFDIDVGSREYACFQHGASIEEGFHRFLLNTPELGDYTCRHVDSADQQIIRLSPGGIYETAQGSGRYTYGDIIDSQGSDIEFSGGPLDGMDVNYYEDALTGQQDFRISETETFGIAVGASTSLTYVCNRFRQPRPYKQYGYAASTLPPSPSIALSGFYYAADIQTGDQSYFRADYYHFRADGFIRRDHPNSIGDDCDRTKPNGLNYCDAYTVADGRLEITRSSGSTKSYSIEINSAGQIDSISGEGVSLITPSATPYVEGVWRNLSYSQSGCYGTGYCSYSYSERTYGMGANGRFNRAYSGHHGSPVETSVSSTYAAGSASNDSLGSYEIRGNRLILAYDNGSIGNHFIYITPANDLVVNGRLYLDQTD